MTRDRKPFVAPDLSEHESGVRSLISETTGERYVAHETLAQAQADPNGVVIFEGDFGGQIYLVARASFVKCSAERLVALLADIDARHWDDPDGARVYFESVLPGEGIAGGMGGGVAPSELWVHPKLGIPDAEIRAVLTGDESGRAL